MILKTWGKPLWEFKRQRLKSLTKVIQTCRFLTILSLSIILEKTLKNNKFNQAIAILRKWTIRTMKLKSGEALKAPRLGASFLTRTALRIL